MERVFWSVAAGGLLALLTGCVAIPSSNPELAQAVVPIWLISMVVLSVFVLSSQRGVTGTLVAILLGLSSFTYADKFYRMSAGTASLYSAMEQMPEQFHATVEIKPGYPRNRGIVLRPDTVTSPDVANTAGPYEIMLDFPSYGKWPGTFGGWHFILLLGCMGALIGGRVVAVRRETRDRTSQGSIPNADEV